MKKNHLLLRFLPVSVVVNGKVIYPIPVNQPVEIAMPTNPSRIVATNGFHISQPCDVTCNFRQNNYYSIGCGIENSQLIAAAVIMILLYAVGAILSIWPLQLVSVAPIFYFLFLYYVKKTEFIKIRPV